MTVDLCTVSGTLVAPDGSPMPAVEVRFLPAPVGLRSQGSATQAPQPVAAVTDAAADLSVGLAPGVYTLRAREPMGREYPPCLIDVPVAETADLAEILLHLPAPQSVYDAAASARTASNAAAAAIAAAAGAGSGGGSGGEGAGPVGWAEVTDKPATFPPEAHGHVLAEVTGLQEALDARAPATDFTATEPGLVPAAGPGAAERFLRADGEFVGLFDGGRVGPTYPSRAAFEAEQLPETVQSWTVRQGGRLLQYVRDPAGTAIESANGVKGSPAGVPTLAHWPTTLEGFRAACAFADGGVLEVPAGEWALHLPAGASATIASVGNLRVVGTSRSDSRIVVTADTSSANLFHTDGLELENLTIQFDQAGGVTHGAVARVRGGATHCRIRNCTILGDTFYPDPSTMERSTYVVHLTGEAGEIIDDVEVSDCEIRSVAYVTLKTNSTASATRSLRQSRNILIDCYREPLGLNSPGGDCDLVVVTGNIVRDFNGAATSDSIVIGFCGCRKVVCSDNVLEADARVFIYCEAACRDVVIADNVCVGNPSAASETGQVGIGVNPNDTTGTMERARNITVTGNILRNTGPRAGFGIWFWDFKTGTEEFAVDGANVQGNMVEGYDTGYRVMVENDNPVSVQGNIARDCTIGFAENHGAAARYESNVSAGCTYGVAARRGGVFDNHRFVGCDEIAGVFVQGSTLLIRTFTVVWPDRDYDAGETVDHELFPVSSVTRALGAATGTLQNHSSGPSVVRHLLENISLTGHTLTKTGGISFGLGTPEAQLVVAASNLVFRAGVTNATPRVRVSVKFEGTALFRPSLVA